MSSSMSTSCSVNLRLLEKFGSFCPVLSRSSASFMADFQKHSDIRTKMDYDTAETESSLYCSKVPLT